tara:strand:+ start:165 stop:278 length:114 start_codon:yes stop_codon:yes gene_type:complete
VNETLDSQAFNHLARQALPNKSANEIAISKPFIVKLS